MERTFQRRTLGILDGILLAGKWKRDRDLPPYILSQIRENEEHLSPLERQVLIALSQNPKTGRAALLRIVREQGVDVTEGKIRRLLQDLSDRGLVRTNRTKGGCEITGKGETFL